MRTLFSFTIILTAFNYCYFKEVNKYTKREAFGPLPTTLGTQGLIVFTDEREEEGTFSQLKVFI